MLVVLGGFLLALRWVGVSQRLRRALNAHPDLIGPARGQLNVHGLQLSDGKLTHWFDRTFVAAAVIRARGIRLPLSADPYHFLALSSRLIEAFDEDLVRQIQSRAAASPPSGDDDALMRGVMAELGDVPAGAIEFSGPVELEIPYDESGQPRQYRVHLATTVGLFVWATISAMQGSLWWALMLAIYACVNSASRIGDWRVWLGRQSTSLHWVQRGWISTNEIVWVSPHYGFRASTVGIKPARLSDDWVSWSFSERSQVRLMRSHVATDHQWRSIVGALD